MLISEEILKRLRENDPTFKKIDFVLIDRDIVALRYMLDALKTNQYVQGLDLFNMPAQAIPELYDMLQVNTSIKEVKLRISWRDTGIVARRQFIKGANTTVTSLDLNFDNVDVRIVRAVLPLCQSFTSLKTFAFSGSQIGMQEARIVAEILRLNSSLQKLRLSSKQAGIENLRIIVEAISGDVNLESLELLGMNLDKAKVRIVAEMLRTNSSLKSLGLIGGKIKPVGAQVLSEALKDNTTLEKLSLGNNPIGDKGARAIAEILRTNSVLKTLILSKCNIKSQGVLSIAQALKVNIVLESINLDVNPIDDKGGRSLLVAMEHNKALKILTLDYTRISEELAKLFLPRFGTVCMRMQKWRFREAIWQGELAKVNSLLEMGIGINITIDEEHGGSPLYLALYEGRIEIVERLLAEPDVDVNWHGCDWKDFDYDDHDDAKKPFDAAAWGGKKDVLYALLRMPKIDRDALKMSDGFLEKQITNSYAPGFRVTGPIILALNRINRFFDALPEDSSLILVRDKCREIESIALVMGEQLNRYVESGQEDPTEFLQIVLRELESSQSEEHASKCRRAADGSLSRLFSTRQAEAIEAEEVEQDDLVRQSRIR
jgi:hypothetical protein